MARSEARRWTVVVDNDGVVHAHGVFASELTASSLAAIWQGKMDDLMSSGGLDGEWRSYPLPISGGRPMFEKAIGR